MHVCMYVWYGMVCMYVCMYVCVYVCYVCYVRMCVCYVSMYVMYVCECTCMYVCMFCYVMSPALALRLGSLYFSFTRTYMCLDTCQKVWLYLHRGRFAEGSRKVRGRARRKTVFGTRLTNICMLCYVCYFMLCCVRYVMLLYHIICVVLCMFCNVM